MEKCEPKRGSHDSGSDNSGSRPFFFNNFKFLFKFLRTRNINQKMLVHGNKLEKVHIILVYRLKCFLQWFTLFHRIHQKILVRNKN